MEQKLNNYVERHLEYARGWKGNSKIVVQMESKAFAAVEFFCELVCEENPELEKKIYHTSGQTYALGALPRIFWVNA